MGSDINWPLYLSTWRPVPDLQLFFSQPSIPHCPSLPAQPLSMFPRKDSAENLNCICSPKFLRSKHQRLFPMSSRLQERWELRGAAWYNDPFPVRDWDYRLREKEKVMRERPPRVCYSPEPQDGITFPISAVIR